MKPAAPLLMLALALLPGPGSVRAQPGSDCVIRLAKVAHPPAFEAYPAGRVQATPLARPVLDTADKRLFRTALRKGAAEGPNIAGHYRIVEWGCGAACNDLALVDTRSGRVTFDERVRVVYTGRVGDEAVTYRADSRLLIVEGLPHEGQTGLREGVYFYEWTGRSLRLIRFVPAAKACAVLPPDSP
jgi:hypothetical protein